MLLVFSLFFSLDDNECEHDSACHVEATCSNTIGSFECSCMEGFEGDGMFNCTSKNYQALV